MTTNQDRRDRSFTRIIEGALLEVGAPDEDDDSTVHAASVSAVVKRKLREAGLAIHDPANCIRRPWQERNGQMQPIESFGRPMTAQEQIDLLGVQVSDEVP